MIIDVFKTIEDHRDPQARQYKLWEILTLYVLAVLGNAKTYEEIGRFAKEHCEKLVSLFGFQWKKAPHYTHIRRILIGVKPELMEAAFREHSNLLNPQKGRSQLCFDGKTLRGSARVNAKATQLFNAFDAYNEIVVAHMPLTDKESEIPALQEFLQQLNVKEVVVTADAIHCQKKLLR